MQGVPTSPVKKRGWRRLWLWLLLIEVLLFSGPVLLVQLLISNYERQGRPVPDHFPFVAWMIGVGLLLFVALLVLDLWFRLRPRIRSKN